MQAILLYSFILTFSYGFAEEKSVPNPVDMDNILPSMDVKNFPSTKDNHVPSSQNDDCNCANVDNILKELSAERVKNRDLNQTISDILEELEDIKNSIIRNEEKIIDNQSSVLLLKRDVEDLEEEVEVVQDDVSAVQGDVAAVQGDVSTVQDDVTKVKDDVAEIQGDVSVVQGDVAAVQGDVSVVQNDVVAVAEDVNRNSADITSLSTRGTWCSSSYEKWSTVGTITYDHLTFSDSKNMDLTGAPLNINSGN